MIRTRLLPALFAVSFLCSLSVFAERPNIVLFMTDDQGWGQTGYMNHPVLKTPNLDAMAANGLRFNRFYAASAVCSPTRASVFTGRTPERSGVPSHGHALRLQERPMPAALQAAGYATGHFGKWHLNGLRGPGVPLFRTESHSPSAFGFDVWLTVSNFFEVDPLMGRNNGEWQQFKGTSSDVIAAQAIPFMTNQVKAKKPFFVVLWDGSPHSPFIGIDKDLEPFADLNERDARHHAELVAVDRAVGTLRKKLRDLGVADNTLFWFNSDNGGLPKIQPDSTGGLRANKGSIYEGGLRVPGIIEWPKIIKPRVTEYPASTVDMFPTVADILDLPDSVLLEPVDGVSLLPLFKEEIGPRSRPLGFRYNGQAAWVDNDYKLVRTKKNDLELYNLAEDKTESKNLAESKPERLVTMRDALAAWEASVDASVAGEDYPQGKVKSENPVPHFWRDDVRYKPWLEEWGVKTKAQPAPKKPKKEPKKAPQKKAAADKRPNILLVMADDHGYGDAGYTGHPFVQTPNMDEMSKHSVVFNRFYASAPVCSPTRASIMTGRNPVRVNVPQHGLYMRPDETTVAEVLQSAGYATGQFGKWHIGSVQPESPTCPGQSGFDEWVSGLNFFDVDPYLSDNGTYKQFNGQGSVISMDETLKFLKKHKGGGKPMFTVTWFPAPHAPFDERPVGLADDLYKGKPMAPYFLEITLLDQQLGRLRKSLREFGIADNTIVWYCSDNGGLVEESSGGRKKKGSVYEGGLRVPALLEWPAKWSRREIDTPCVSSDMYPTLLRIAGAKAKHQPPLDGIDLVPVIEGKRTKRPPIGFWHNFAGGNSTWNDALIKQLMVAQQAGEPTPLPNRLLKNVEEFPVYDDAFRAKQRGHAALTDWPWKIHRFVQKNKEVIELYHLENDPMESKDLAEDEAKRTTKMLKQLKTWQNSVLDSHSGADYNR